MTSLTFSVIEIAPQDGYSIVRVQVGSTTPDISVGDAFGMAVTNEIAALNTVGEPFVEAAPPVLDEPVPDEPDTP